MTFDSTGFELDSNKVSLQLHRVRFILKAIDCPFVLNLKHSHTRTHQEMR